MTYLYIVGYEFLQLLWKILSFEGNTYYFVSLPNIYVNRKGNQSNSVARDKPHVLAVQFIEEELRKSGS